MKERFLHILCRLILIVAACPIDASALVLRDVAICNECNGKGGIAPDGGVSEWWNDNWSRAIRYNNPKGGVTRYAYDIADNLLRVDEPDGNVRELTYDKEYNVIRAKDRQREVRFSYKGVNKLASRTENGATLRFSYDTEDQLRAVFNEKGEKYAFVLDAQGDVKQEIGFDGITRTYERNLAGQVTSVIAPKKKETLYEYDPVGRVTQVTHADGTTETYTYRKDGSLLTATNPDAEVEFTRDILGRVTVETCNGYEVKSTYDTDGNRTRITSSLGADIAAAYNPLGDLLGMTSGNWQTDYQRDLFGLETGRSMAGGIATETERDRLGRVTSQITRHNRRRVTEKEYIWGLNDQLLSITNNGKQTLFEYDGWGNLAKATYPDGKIIHRNPDKTGNLFATVDRIDRKYSTGGRLEQSTNWTYKYDDEGHLTEKRHRVQVQQAWKYRWNDAGMLEEVVRPDGSTVSFKYDALGRRIEKRLFNRKTRWVWDGNVPLHEWNEVYTKDFTEEKGEFYSMKPSKTTTWLFEEGTFVPNGKLVGEESFSIQSNYLGTPEVMYNADGKVVWSAELDAYGDVRELTGERTDCPFRYQGQYEDRETGLYYNRFRYYSAEEGMYISQDKIRLKGGDNLYGYVHNPNLYFDILGLDYVYQIVDKEDNVVYYGITERDPVARGNEHVDSENLKDGERMEVIAKDVNHDQARTIEATKIRDTIEEAGGRGSVQDQLSATKLRNKNRGRDIKKRPFNPKTMGGDFSLLDKPEEVKGLKKAKCPS